MDQENKKEETQKRLLRGMRMYGRAPEYCQGCAFAQLQDKTHPRDMWRGAVAVIGMCVIIPNKPEPVGATCKFWLQKELSTDNEVECMRSLAIAEHVRNKAGVK